MNNRRVAVIGAGITGLTAAYRLQSQGVDVHVYEASSRIGGSIQTLTMGDCRVDIGPSGVLASRDSFVRLVRDLNIEDHWVRASEASNKRFIYYRGRLREVPTSPLKLVTCGWLPLSAKWRIATEIFRQAHLDEHQTEMLTDFVARRFGHFVAEVMVDAMVSGIHGAPAHTLEAKAAFPILAQLEREHGTVIGGMIQTIRAKRRQLPEHTHQLKGMLNLANGFESLTDALGQSIDNLRLNDRVLKVVRKAPSLWEVQSETGAEAYTDILITTTADVARRCLEDAVPPLAHELGNVRYTPLINVIMHFEERISTPQGFGYLNPGVENRSMLGCLFLHHVFPELIPYPNTVFRAFLGGQRAKDQIGYDDATLVKLAKTELEDVLGLELPTPRHVEVLRWPTSIAFYQAGTCKLWESIDKLLEKEAGLRLGGNWYHGVSVADCITRGEKLAQDVITSSEPNIQAAGRSS